MTDYNIFQLNCKDCNYKSKRVPTTDLLFKEAEKDGATLEKYNEIVYSEKQRKNQEVIKYIFKCPKCKSDKFSLIANDAKKEDDFDYKIKSPDNTEVPIKKEIKKAIKYNSDEKDDDIDDDIDEDIPEGFHLVKLDENDEEVFEDNN